MSIGVKNMNREDFPMLKNNIIYFDNAATSFKPKCVIDSIAKYYSEYCSNCHRGDYDISYMVDSLYEEVRDTLKKFINAKYREEIVFTSGTTESLNMVANGFCKNYLKPGDEILITNSEHASNVLPWFNLAKKIGCKIRFIDLTEDYHVTIENVKKAISQNTKIIGLAQVTNVIGDVRPIKEIAKFALCSLIKTAMNRLTGSLSKERSLTSTTGSIPRSSSLHAGCSPSPLPT